ncbi:MAG: NADH dehydrogenase subunit, partial [Nitrospirae bacterium]
FICCIADDENQDIHLLSHVVKDNIESLPSLTLIHPAMHCFEREIHEQFGILFKGHPWLKPLRFCKGLVDEYPFYSIDSEQIHEVGVGPIHAGIIEPGHFRFICLGENILHLEIQLGYQHRGVERLFIEHKNWIYRTTLSESIAGDTTIGHTLSFVQAIEALCGVESSMSMLLSRTVALELERIAVHTGDLSAMFMDIAYQLGSAVFGALRTPIINFMQKWCGNRFGRRLLRIGYAPYPLTHDLAEELLYVLSDYEERFMYPSNEMLSLPSVLHRFERTGVLTKTQAELSGAVGMAARMCGLKRDIRWSHPFLLFKEMPYEPVVIQSGDVMARAMLRKKEIESSLAYIRGILKDNIDKESQKEHMFSINRLKPESLSISLVESWRGEICHTALTDREGEVIAYKIVDPSLHNWLCLALCVRENEISDFPICNKSFNLSYCGHDL